MYILYFKKYSNSELITKLTLLFSTNRTTQFHLLSHFDTLKSLTLIRTFN